MGLRIWDLLGVAARFLWRNRSQTLGGCIPCEAQEYLEPFPRPKMKNLLALASALSFVLPCSAQQGAEAKPAQPVPVSGAEVEPGENSPQDPDRAEATKLVREMEATLEQIWRAQAQVRNVRQIFDKLDSGAVEATEKEMIKTNQFMRRDMTKQFRELRLRAKSVKTQIETELLPKQRGMSAKLRARWELESNAETKERINRLKADHEQSVGETEAQVQRLEVNIQNLTGAIQILEGQLSYLDLVEESLGLSKEVSKQLRDLNQEIDKVVNALMEKELKQ